VHIYQVNDGSGSSGTSSAGSGAPAIPAITSFSPDTGSVAGLTDANVLTLAGTAAANSTVNLYDGTVLLGTAAAGASAAWSFPTTTLADGVHSFTATDTLAGVTSASSATLAVTVDTIAPAAPIITSDVTNSNNAVAINGTALDHGVGEAGDLIQIYDG